MRGYRLELSVAGVGERLGLTAEDDNAARRQALLALADLLRDQALRGLFDARIDLTLFDAAGELLYEAQVTGT